MAIKRVMGQRTAAFQRPWTRPSRMIPSTHFHMLLGAGKVPIVASGCSVLFCIEIFKSPSFVSVQEDGNDPRWLTLQVTALVLHTGGRRWHSRWSQFSSDPSHLCNIVGQQRSGEAAANQ
jgi:hypothetical protein